MLASREPGSRVPQTTMNRRNTSPPQRVMRRISPNNPVRRRLFPEAHLEEQARNDNHVNVLQESLARDMAAKTKQWNFDFKNETPLPGKYEWSKRDGENWIGMEVTTKVCDENFHMQEENEKTPSTQPDRVPAQVRKRKSDAELTESGARRKISF